MNDVWLGELIEGAYEAAENGSWYEWLDSFRRALASQGAILTPLARHHGLPHFMPIASGQQHYDLQEQAYYQLHQEEDPYYLAMVQQLNKVVVLNDELRIRRQASEQGPFLEMLQSRIRHSVASITDGPGSQVMVGLFRGKNQPAFEPEQLQDIELVLQHLSRAMALVPFIEERVAHRLQKTGLAGHPGPTAVVRSNGTPVYINSAMDSYLASDEKPIEIFRGRLVADRPLMQRLLERAQQRANAQESGVRLPLGADEQMTIRPLPVGVYPNATLWRIG